MTDVFQQLHDVIERGAGEPPPIGDLGRTSGHRQSRRVVPVAMAVALLSALVVGLTLNATSHRRPNSPVATTTTSPAPVGGPSIGFVSVSLHSNGLELTEWTWSGRRLETLHTGLDYSCCSVSLAPDHRLILVQGARSSEVLSTTGRVVSRLTSVGGAIWSDDSRHLCLLSAARGEPGNGLARLDIIGLNGHAHFVPRTVPGGNMDHTDAELAYCDLRTHTALDVLMTMGSITQLTSVDTSTGATRPLSWSRHLDYQLAGDQRYAALINGKIVSTATGATVATVPGQPIAISWLGHVVVYWNVARHTVAYDWATGRTLWTDNSTGPGCHCNTASVSAETGPRSDDMALTVSPPLVHNRAALVLIGPGHRPRVLDRSILPGVVSP